MPIAVTAHSHENINIINFTASTLETITFHVTTFMVSIWTEHTRYMENENDNIIIVYSNDDWVSKRALISQGYVCAAFA